MSLRTPISSSLLLLAVAASVATSQGPSAADFYEHVVTMDQSVDVVDTFSETVFIGIDEASAAGVLESWVSIDLVVDVEDEPVEITIFNEDGVQVAHEVAVADDTYSYHLANPLYCQFLDDINDICLTQVSYDVSVPGGFATVDARYELGVQGDPDDAGVVSIWTN